MKHFEGLCPKKAKELEERWALEKEAVEILKLVVSEWNTDPKSVQCFDLRVVSRAKLVSKRLEKLVPEWERGVFKG